MRSTSTRSASTRKPPFVVKNPLGQRITISDASPEDIATAQHAYFELYSRYDSQHPTPPTLLIPSSITQSTPTASPVTVTPASEMAEPTLEELQRRLIEQQLRHAEEKHQAEMAAIQGLPKDPATGMSISPSVTRVLQSIPGVNATMVAKIVNNTFSAKDLVGLLRLAKPIVLEEELSLNDNRTITRMPRGYNLKDFGFNSRIWSHAFIGYTRVIMALHGTEHPDITDAMLAFYCEIMSFTEAYHWQLGVLPLAIAWHDQVHQLGPLVAENWKISQLWRDLYITPGTIAKATPPKNPTTV